MHNGSTCIERSRGILEKDGSKYTLNEVVSGSRSMVARKVVSSSSCFRTQLLYWLENALRWTLDQIFTQRFAVNPCPTLQPFLFETGLFLDLRREIWYSVPKVSLSSSPLEFANL